jgi:tetratricopeptide (TPR) repeat protein
MRQSKEFLKILIATCLAISVILDCSVSALPYSAEVRQHLAAGRNYIEHGDYQRAKDELDRAIKTDPTCTDALNNLGVVFLRTHDLPAAKSCFENALRLNGKFAPGLNNLAQVYALQGDNDDAILLYKEALRHSPESVWEVETNLANVLRDRNLLMESSHHYEMAIKMRPNYANAHCGYAKLLYLTHKYEKARQEAIKAIVLKPDYAMAYFHLGLVERELGLTANAAKAFSISLACEKNPQYASETRQFIERLAVPAEELTEESLQAYRVSLQQAHSSASGRDPGRLRSLASWPSRSDKSATQLTAGATKLAQVASLEQAHEFMKSGKWENAQKELIALRKTDDPVVLNDIGYTFAGLQQYDQALKYYSQAVKESGGACYNALYNMGQAYKAKHNKRAAADAYLKAIQAASRQNKPLPLAQNAIALILKDKGDLRGAESAFKLALFGSEDYPVIHYNYAIFLEKTGDTRRAAEEYKTYLEMAPEGVNVKQAKARLRRLGIDT